MDEPKKEKSQLPKDINDFHDHLDVCEQCREHPFDLCPVGAERLRKAATK